MPALLKNKIPAPTDVIFESRGMGANSDAMCRAIEWCHSDEGLRHLPEDALGWTSGGCGVLGFALASAFPGAEAMGIFGYQDYERSGLMDGRARGTAILQHLIVEYAGHFFDGRGDLGCDGRAVAKAYGELEGLAVTGWRPVSRAEVAITEIPCAQSAIQRLKLNIMFALVKPSVEITS